MDVRELRRVPTRLPEDDDHPYRTGAWRPNEREYDATGLEVVGEIPKDLDGVYLRNTENPVMPSVGRYHPFDGDGMVHAMRFKGGAAEYHNRFVRTAGLAAELEAGRALWAGIIESPALSERDGWGARTRMKDASSTDVVVHHGVALTSFYQCGELYRMDPVTLDAKGVETWGGRFPREGVSAHARVDENTGELLFFNYSAEAPFMHYGVLDPDGSLAHYVPIELPGPRLPHDMAFTERYAILNDFPLYWDAALMQRDVYRPRFHPEQPSRFGVIPRRGGSHELRWFEAEPTYVLHFINAWEEGDEVVLDGYHQAHPIPSPRPGDDAWGPLKRGVDMLALGTTPRRWRFNLRTGATREEPLDDEVTEFPTIHGRFAGRRHRYFNAMTSEPGWFLFNGLLRYDLQVGLKQRYRYPAGVFASEAPVAPRAGTTGENDAYVVTFVSDLNEDRSECHVFDARDISRGPVARVKLPERICAGTHACWAPGEALGR